MIVSQSLQAKDVSEAMNVVHDLAGKYHSVENTKFLTDLSINAHTLPLGIRKFINEFRLADGVPAVAILSGFPVEQDRIGQTPAHWDRRSDVIPTVPEEMYLMLCGAILADVFGWATLQGGYLVHDILPIKELECEQIGGSSKEALYWHTEDAFHPYRADYVGLMCLRNPDNTETTIGTFDPEELDDDIVDLLFQPRFFIRTDESHTEAHQGRKDFWHDQDKSKLGQAYERRQEANQEPVMVPILRGSRTRPDLCIDPVYMDNISTDPEADRALKTVIEAIERNMFDVSMSPGDVLFLDNTRVVHGRNSFNARYDGSDRWLKRIYLTRDLSKSRDARGGPSARLIF